MERTERTERTLTTVTIKSKWVCPKGHYEQPSGCQCTSCPVCGGKLHRVFMSDPPLPVDACAMAKFCPGASERCKTVPVDVDVNVTDWRTTGATRYMDCYTYKADILGLTFKKDLGVYVQCRCPTCGADLVKHLQRLLDVAKNHKN